MAFGGNGMSSNIPAALRPESPWLIARCRPREGTWNMAADVALLEHTVATGQPALRLYAFSPATITVGRSENLESVVARDACVAAGIGVAQRPTGGRAVLHDEELTYCVTIPQSAAGRASPAAGREAVAQVVGERLCDALRSLHVPAEIVRTSAPLRTGTGYRSCFASASRESLSSPRRFALNQTASPSNSTPISNRPMAFGQKYSGCEAAK